MNWQNFSQALMRYQQMKGQKGNGPQGRGYRRRQQGMEGGMLGALLRYHASRGVSPTGRGGSPYPVGAMSGGIPGGTGAPQLAGAMSGGIPGSFSGRQQVALNTRAGEPQLRSIGGVDLPPAELNVGGTTAPYYYPGSSFNPPPGNYNPAQYLGTNPPPGTPGFGQGPTMIPTTFDSQGYPNAVPASSSSLGGWPLVWQF